MVLKMLIMEKFEKSKKKKKKLPENRIAWRLLLQCLHDLYEIIQSYLSSDLQILLVYVLLHVYDFEMLNPKFNQWGSNYSKLLCKFIMVQ